MNGIHLKTFVHHDGMRGIYNIISENEINYNSYGIRLNYSDHNDIFDNDVKSNNYYGIFLDNSDYTLISRNIINNNYHGVNVLNSINNDLLTNTINNNYCGIYFTDSHKNIVFNNTILNSVKCYVENGRCIDNTFEDNICQESLVLNEWIILGIILTASAIGLASLFLIINRKKKRLVFE
jgi:parallel beta-helix repeat protein